MQLRFGICFKGNWTLREYKLSLDCADYSGDSWDRSSWNATDARVILMYWNILKFSSIKKTLNWVSEMKWTGSSLGAGNDDDDDDDDELLGSEINILYSHTITLWSSKTCDLVT